MKTDDIIAWQHKDMPECVISDRVKQLWLDCKPKQVENYTIPLVAKRDFSDFIRNASVEEKTEVYTEVMQKASEAQQQSMCPRRQECTPNGCARPDCKKP